MRTTDSTGRPIDAPTLAETQRILIESTPIWSGGQFGVVEVLVGAGTREMAPGWLTIKWTGEAMAGRCGHSTVGVDGGVIEFNNSGACRCDSSLGIYRRLVRHELGHAMGFYHTDNVGDVMYGQTIRSDACDLEPSDRERRHARIVYAEKR